MDRLRVPPLLVFAAVSAVAHAGAFAAATRHASKSAATLEFDPTTQALAGRDAGRRATGARSRRRSRSTRPSPRPHHHRRRARRSAPPRPAGSSHARRSSRLARMRPPGGAPPALFGAVGVRFATDLATTFTRAFPQAASADPVWSTASFGNAGTADVTLLLDDAGHLAGSSIKGSPSQALRRGIERTLALLGPRAFTAHGADDAASRRRTRRPGRRARRSARRRLRAERRQLLRRRGDGVLRPAGIRRRTAHRRRAQATAVRAFLSVARGSSARHGERPPGIGRHERHHLGRRAPEEHVVEARLGGGPELRSSALATRLRSPGWPRRPSEADRTSSPMSPSTGAKLSSTR